MSVDYLRQLGWPVKSILSALLLGTVVSLFIVFHLIAAYDYRSRPPVCEVQRERREQVARTAFEVSEALTELGIDHALCYGSLLGALRTGRMLATEDHVDLCVMDTYMKDVFTIFEKKLSQVGLAILYNSKHGEFRIKQRRQPASPDVIITVFYHAWRGKARKVGFVRWILSFFNRDSLDAFPQDLLQGPLTKMTFEGWRMPVPNRDAEVLKSMYPDDWWFDRSRHECPDVTSLSLPLS